ncbi:MAG TPA: hypothetical protein PKA61_07375 [Nitrospira sp.]|mgnify:CR=1 FL=1|nr:hypothetical protein [Nitrospira sp.]
MRKEWMCVKSGVLAAVMVGGLLAMGGTLDKAEAALVTQLDFSMGAANWSGKQGRVADRLLDQDGTIKLGSYQAWGDITDPVRSHGKKYSLFTSDLLGAPAPTATIDGMNITVDLSSLFLGWKRGGELHLWNIGGEAKGLFNPETKEFSLSWNNLVDGKSEIKTGRHDRGVKEALGTFFLQGKVEGTVAPVAIPAAVFLYGTGLFGVGSWAWLKRRQQQPVAA